MVNSETKNFLLAVALLIVQMFVANFLQNMGPDFNYLHTSTCYGNDFVFFSRYSGNSVAFGYYVCDKRANCYQTNPLSDNGIFFCHEMHAANSF